MKRTTPSLRTLQEMRVGKEISERNHAEEITKQRGDELRKRTGADFVLGSRFDRDSNVWFVEITASGIDNGERVIIFRHDESIHVFPSDELVTKLVLIGGGRDTGRKGQRIS